MLRRSPVLRMVFISTQRHTTWRYVTERHVMLSAVSLSGIDVDPSLIISTPVPWRGRSWCGSQQEPGAFVPCSEPEHVAVFSLLSWSATISKSNSSYLYLFAVPVLFSATLNQNWTNMVRCQVPPDVFFHLSIIRYGAIHQSSFFLRSARSIGDFFFTLFHTLRRRGWQMRIMCNIARRIGYTWLIKTAAHGARRCDRNNNHTSLRLGNSQSYCFPWGTPPRLLLARC